MDVVLQNFGGTLYLGMSTKVLNAGRYVDMLVREDGKLRFKQKRCVYDSSVVPNSLVYPV